MGYIQGEGRSQGTLFPVVLDDLVPADHVCRVIDAFVAGLPMLELGFERAEAAETGRPGYDPRDLLKLCLYGYLHQIRSSRRLEAECHRNVELDGVLGSGHRGVFISTRLMGDRFALSFEFFINVAHAFVDEAGVPERFAELAWNQALTNTRGETSLDAWEARNLALGRPADWQFAQCFEHDV